MRQPLTPDRFAEFFTAANDGRDPFPWQVRLVREIFESNGRWPDLFDLPTASGKTSTVEIALYTLAAGLDVPRRIVFVVDRRVIVQQAADHARRLAQKLAQPGVAILADVRAGLQARQADVGEHRQPFVVAELRGAIQQDHMWAERPDVPAVIASTVDQIGSRLLFRGYGVSDRMLPIHAGLIGNDALIVLDEVHLARPFADLLDRIKANYRPTGGVTDRWQVVALSATPSSVDGRRTFSLDSADRQHPVLDRRLSARKPARPVTVKAPADPERALEALAKEHIARTVELLEHPRVRSVGVVVNRVRLAGLINRRLADLVSETADVVLITGRMRGLDRDVALAQVTARVASGAQNSAEQRKFVVVATQTIEAGADLDFDAIVTDCASIDALIQRFGRVDRMGLLSASITDDDERPRSVVVGTNRTAKETDDPIYGSALSETWQWLGTRASGEVDFGSGGIELPDGPVRRSMMRDPDTGPVLTRSHLDRFVRTSPKPDADVDIAYFLHGLGRKPDQEVEIVWRSDLFGLGEAARDPRADTAEDLADLIAAIPPSPGEALAVPLSHARAWLSQRRPAGAVPEFASRLSDVEGVDGNDVERGAIRPCLVWRAGEASAIASARDLHPGDTIVVPSEYGGITNRNWDPTGVKSVADIAEPAAAEVGRLRLRLNPITLDPAEFPDSDLPTDEVIRDRELSGAAVFRIREAALQRSVVDEQGVPTIEGSIPTPDAVDEAGEDATVAIRNWLKQFVPSGRHDVWEKALVGLKNSLGDNQIQRVPGPFGSRIYLLSSRIDAYGLVADRDIDSDPDRSSNVAVAYGLDRHLRDVERWTSAFLGSVGVEGDLGSTVRAAALAHDMGKADSRFQAYLREGRLASQDDPLLAKSSVPAQDRARDRRARILAGLPRRLRHELASVALATQRTAADVDAELLRFLIASHHGHGRPFFPAQIDPDEPDVGYTGELGDVSVRAPYRYGRPGSQLSSDFESSLHRFGWFGVAWLESLLRLADHGASRQIASGDSGSGRVR